MSSLCRSYESRTQDAAPIMSQDAATNYYNPNIIHLYEYDNDLKTYPCLVN